MKHNIAKETVVCNQCGSAAHTVIAHGTDREYASCDDDFTIAQCNGCSLIFLNPRPAVSELSTIYPETYHSYILDEAEGSKGSFITRMRQKAGINRFRPVLKHIENLPSVDLLDVGCGNGWMLNLFRAADPKRIRTHGVEISAPVCDIARKQGHTVYCGRFEDVTLDRQFDVINLTHVIEHVSDPRGVVKKAFQSLKPGGLLVLETPNIGAYEWRWFRSGDWGAYHIPRHWYFYDRGTLRTLGESEGFRMIDHYCHPGPTHWVWTLHNVSLRGSGTVARFFQRVFDPVRIFKGGPVSTVVMIQFFLLDFLMLRLGRQTSVMTGIFSKPA